ncbi:MAG: NUDIX hydrolase, partial [Verrucomicrobia bacterium]|nr:NUDIX hydrolase [Verrucomicrobiota bacterium]
QQNPRCTAHAPGGGPRTVNNFELCHRSGAPLDDEQFMDAHFPSPKNSESAVRAAGGLVWRSGPQEPELLIIRRFRHGTDEWSLPKGKLDAGEHYAEAALREVAEETGVRARLGRFAGVLQYGVNGQSKVVCMWEMTAETVGQPEDTEEVAEIRWVVRDEALRLLSHEQNRELLRHLPPPAL